MIHLAIAQVVDELNAYLNLRSPGLTPERVVAGSLFDLAGALNTKTKDRVVASVVNVEENRVYHSLDTYQTRADGMNERVKPKVRVNVYLLFVGNFDKYDEALKAISNVIGFFQHRNVFVVSGNGAEESSRVVYELYSLTFEQQNHLWAALGAKYMPAVMYKAGIVDIRDTQVEAEVPPVEEIATEA
ncbi:MAG: hypothetical protein A3H35_17160 [Betaproteobacteria bacterium RIFCSPLOWO2_02_FULL_62_17]|nr:MAG: hypothetical protein A3H35_17160 [Betaproteobacteria bacterium RIFCSPLOWO2_02_FULL_62_17]